MRKFGVLFILIATALAFDPCEYEAQQLLTVTDMLECWSLIPYNGEIASATISTLLKTIPLYVFLDMARNSPDPRLPVQISLDDALANLNTSFDYDYQLHAALDDIFTQLRDGHTRYLAPKNYGSFTYGFPLGLEIFVENDEMQMSTSNPISDDLVAFYGGLGIDLLSLSNSNVIAIQGESAVSFMMDFARDRVGLVLDPSARVNLAVSDIFPQSFINRSISNIEKAVNVTFDISGETVDVQIPLYARAKRQLDVETFMDLYKPTPIPPQKRPSATLDHFFPEIPLPKAMMTPALEGPGIQLFYLPNPHQDGEQVCIFVISTFEPGTGSDSDETEFRAIFTQGLQECRTQFVRQYLLDFSFNPGGDIELANFVVSTLFPDFSAMTIFDMRKSPLQDLIFDQASQDPSQVFYFPTFRYNVENGQEYQDGSWYTNTRTFERGGVESNYSQPYYWNLGISETLSSSPKTNLFTEKNTVGPNQYLVLTKGICASACSITTSYLHLFDGVKTIAAGGILGQDQMFSAIPANVIEFSDLQALVAQYRIESPLVPELFPTSGAVRFAFQEVYGFDLNTPLQYIFDQADFRLPFTRESAVNQTALWLDAMSFFDE